MLGKDPHHGARKAAAEATRARARLGGPRQRLALDLTASGAAFEQVDREGSTPRSKPDLSVFATICALKGSLMMVRREYVAATRELDPSCTLFRQLGQAGKVSEAVEDLWADCESWLEQGGPSVS